MRRFSLHSPHPLRDALHISYAAAACSGVSGTLAIMVGLATTSTALIGTGADVVADMASSIVLISRFRMELQGHPSSARAEERAERVAAAALMLVAIGITTTAITRLVAGRAASASALGIVVAAVSVLVFPAFAFAKYRIAERVPSPALRMDGHITLVGAVMAFVTLAGLAATESLGWSWADPCAALIVAALALSVGADTLRVSLKPSLADQPDNSPDPVLESD